VLLEYGSTFRSRSFFEVPFLPLVNRRTFCSSVPLRRDAAKLSLAFNGFSLRLHCPKKDLASPLKASLSSSCVVSRDFLVSSRFFSAPQGCGIRRCSARSSLAADAVQLRYSCILSGRLSFSCCHYRLNTASFSSFLCESRFLKS